MKRLITMVAASISVALSTFAVETFSSGLNFSQAAVAPEGLSKTYITEAEGEVQRYAASGFVSTSWGLLDFAGQTNDLIVSNDGNKIFFESIGLVKDAQKKGTYILGEVSKNQEGKRVITVKANQLMRNYDTLDEWLMDKMEMTAEEYAIYMDITLEEVAEQVKWTGPRYFYFVPAIEDALSPNGMRFLDEFVMVESENGNFKPALDQRVNLLSYSYEAGGSDHAIADLTLSKVNHSLCNLPDEGIEYKTYQLTVKNPNDDDKSTTCKVGFKDNKIYLPGLLYSGEYKNQYMEGEIGEDGTITLSSSVFYGEESDEYRRIRAFGKNTTEKIVDDIFVLVPDEEYDPIKLNYDVESGKISLFGDGWIIDFPYGSERYSEFRAPTYICLDNLKFDEPAQPTNLKYDSSYLSFKVPFTDINGKEIPSGFLYWQLFIDSDDNVFVFDPDEFWINEATTEIPVNFEDFDIINDGDGNIRLYWSKSREWEDLGVRLVLNYNDEKKYSNITWLLKTGIEGVETDLSEQPAFDVLGRRVNNEYKGIVIQNGKKSLRR